MSLISRLFSKQFPLFGTCYQYLHTTLPSVQFDLWNRRSVESDLWKIHARNGPPKRRPRDKSPIAGYPQIRGIVLKTMIKRPKKPNAGNRPCCLVRLTNGREVTAWIPGVGHNLQEHSQVMICGGRKQDLIGVKCKVMRGKLDCAPAKKPDK